MALHSDHTSPNVTFLARSYFDAANSSRDQLWLRRADVVRSYQFYSNFVGVPLWQRSRNFQSDDVDKYDVLYLIPSKQPTFRRTSSKQQEMGQTNGSCVWCRSLAYDRGIYWLALGGGTDLVHSTESVWVCARRPPFSEVHRTSTIDIEARLINFGPSTQRRLSPYALRLSADAQTVVKSY